MKNYIFIIKVVLFIVIITTLSCQKESADVEFISQVPDPTATYSKELTVSDSSQKNTVFLLVSSNDEELLEHYLNYVSIELEIVEKDVNNEFSDILNKTIIEHGPSNNIDSICEEFKIDLESEQKIFIEFIASNLESRVGNYYLSMHPKNIKTYYPYNTPAVEFITSSDFVGIVHSGYGNPFLKGFSTKKNFLSRWKDGIFGELYPFSYGDFYPYSDQLSGGDYYRRAVMVHQHYEDRNNGIINYKFADKKSEFYGRTCSYVGNYDGWSCYVGSPPAGTTAFIYPINGTLRFYYTPVSGNQCPVPGSTFDGANCKYITVPEQTKAFIWDNKWYVYPDVIPT